jgi:hypothetical protein
LTSPRPGPRAARPSAEDGEAGASGMWWPGSRLDGSATG